MADFVLRSEMSNSLHNGQMPKWIRREHLLMFAAIPEQETVGEIQVVWERFGTGDPFRRRTLHATILGVVRVDEVPPEMVTAIRKSADQLSVPSFDLLFDRLMTFNGRGPERPIVLGVDGWSESMNLLGEMLRKELARRGIFLRKPGRITPHVTLAYGEGFSGTRFLPKPIPWRVKQISLIDSLQGMGRHIRLGNWPLSTLH